MGKKLLFQGDSITDCGRKTSGGAGYPVDGWGPGYPGLIGSYLTGNYPEMEWQVANLGISGNRVVDLYARWKLDALNLAPDFISILIGINDTWHEKARQNGVEVPRYEQFYRMLLDWSISVLPEVRFILMEPFALCFGAVSEDWIPEVDARRDVVRRIAADYRDRAVFVPLQQPLNDACRRAPQEHWLVDGVHPRPAGHQLIMNEWLKAAGPMLGVK